MIWDFIFRLFVAGVLGAIIGLDREYRAKEAGFRTHFLVACGSALFMIVSKYAFGDLALDENLRVDASRIASNVVTGVSFLGAGVIFVKEQSIRGLTTAAGIWATAGLGLAIAKEIIEHYGGEIKLSSVYKEGTTVSVYLPMKAGADI